MRRTAGLPKREKQISRNGSKTLSTRGLTAFNAYSRLAVATLNKTAASGVSRKTHNYGLMEQEGGEQDGKERIRPPRMCEIID